MDKYIKREDLGEIMEALAESGMKHPEIRVCMDIETWLGEQMLKVRVYDTSFKIKASQDYVMIGGIEDDFDVLEQTVETAIAIMEKEKAEAEKKAESEVESTTNTK